MANILEPCVVNYACGCGKLNSITKLYFCRHCLTLRCGFCVCHEVDSHFCSNCLENIPSSEAKLKKNRCNKCFDCPCCQHTLSTRATTSLVKRKSDGKDESAKDSSASAADAKPISRKMYYLSCLACRWSSRDVGISDQTAATGQWPESEYAHATRFSLLLEHYQNVVLQDKQEKQDLWRRKTPKQHKYPNLTDRTGLTVSIVRRQLGWSDNKNVPKLKKSTINSSEAKADVNDLPDNIFTHPPNLTNITTLKQRLNHPALQPFTVNYLYPQHKSLSIKRSLRCRQCEHNVIKPEFNPISIKYRIQLFASYHVPEVRLMKPIIFEEGVSGQVVLKIINPTIKDMTITIMDLPTKEEEQLLIEDMKKKFESQVSISSTPSLGTFSRQASLTEDPKFVDEKVTGNIILPDASFILNHRDDSAEYDEEVQAPGDDPKFLVWRRSNKAAIELTVNPLNCKSGQEVLIGFTMQYTYWNSVSNSPDKKGQQMHALTSRIYIRVGEVK